MPRFHANIHRSSHNSEIANNSHAMKNQKTDLEVAKKASFIDEDAHQMRAPEMDVGASSSILLTDDMSNTNGVDIGVLATEGQTSAYVWVSGHQTRPLYERSMSLCASGFLHVPLFTKVFYALGTIT